MYVFCGGSLVSVALSEHSILLWQYVMYIDLRQFCSTSFFMCLDEGEEAAP